MSERYIPNEADIVSKCRSFSKPGAYSILADANRVETTVPGFAKTTSKFCASPHGGAKFIQLELFIEPGGGTEQTVSDEFQYFIYVLEGSLQLTAAGKEYDMEVGGFSYLPDNVDFSIKNTGSETSRVIWFKKRYIPLKGVERPGLIVDNEKNVTAYPEDTYVEKHLIPYDDDLRYDMCFNLLVFEPGIYFGLVETHIMEHSLYMLSGSGLYWLNGDYHEVQKDDFIYMAPYCPQYFYSTGWKEVRYLLYKDYNRDFEEDL